MDINTLSLSAVGAVLSMALVYYCVRTLRFFKTNFAARASTYISLTAVFFGIGLVIFIIDALDPMGLLPVGAVSRRR